MALFNLYKVGRYGLIHVTTNRFNSFIEAEKYYTTVFGYDRSKWNQLFSYKISGL